MGPPSPMGKPTPCRFARLCHHAWTGKFGCAHLQTVMQRRCGLVFEAPQSDGQSAGARPHEGANTAGCGDWAILPESLAASDRPTPMDHTTLAALRDRHPAWRLLALLTGQNGRRMKRSAPT